MRERHRARKKNDVSRYLSPFDVRRFGAKAEYVDATHRGSDTRNKNAFADWAAALAHYGGTGIIPASSYKYWLGDEPIDLVQDGIDVEGEHRLGSCLVWEPAASAVLFNSRKTSSQLGGCSFSNFSVQGFGAEYAGTRYPKVAFHVQNWSEGALDRVNTLNWISTTGDPSKALVCGGREITTVSKCRFFADRPVSIEANPDAASFANIDNDGFRFTDMYLGVYDPDEAGLHIEPNLTVRNFVMNGANNIVGAAHPMTATKGGKYGIYWNDPTSAIDCTQFHVENLRVEQMTGATGASVLIDRAGTGYTYGLALHNIEANTEHRGFVLNGIRNGVLDQCSFQRHADQGTSPMGLVIGARIIDVANRSFNLPIGTHTLYTVDAAVTVTDQSNGAPTYSQIPNLVHYHNP